ncbi:hypothetical protein U6M47_13130, partial [Cutibacterium acnes]
VGILDRHELREPEDVLALLGPRLPAGEFTTAELAVALSVPLVLAQRIAFCLRYLELAEQVGRRGHAPLYRRSRTAPAARPPF